MTGDKNLGPSLATALLLAIAVPAAALDADKNQPITLEADDFELDLDAGARTYRGNVQFRQGSLRLNCDALVTRHADDGELQTGECAGAPGRFQQRPEGRAEAVRGRANTITLDHAAGRVTLDGDAEVELAGDRLQGQRIVYDFNSKKVRVTGGGSGGDDGNRPRLIIQPRNQGSN